jgi:16S rRNA G966 N2-methylase RsmD
VLLNAPHDQRTTWPVHPAAELFPLLADDELQELAEDIRANGLHELVWLYDDPYTGQRMLLDGRNRSRACQLAGIPVRTRLYTGNDPIAFSLSQNLKRRHLTSGQRDFLALDVEKLYAEEAAKRTGGRPRIGDKPPADLPEVSEAAQSDLVQTQPDLSARLPQHVAQEVAERKARESRERAAKVTGTSGRGVSQAKRVEKFAPDLAEKVKAGKLAIDRAERIVRDRAAEAKRVAEAQAAAAAAPVQARSDIRHGDFREVLADLRDVDAIITDPPYPHEYLPLLDDLAAWSDKVLAPDGVLVILFGQMYLPEVYRRLDGHRPYRWTGCYLTPGAGYVSMPRRVQSNWKPLLVYGGGPRFADTLSTEGSDAGAKSLHKWGQDYAAFHTLIERFTKPGQTVVDPFAGSGTTLLAAKALGRHAIGAELDPDHVRTARERVA